MPDQSPSRYRARRRLANCILVLGIAILSAMLLPSLSGCACGTGGLKAVDNFQAGRYMGAWYEIARFPHWFERGMSHVTASYALRPDGKVSVVNRGYSASKGKWTEATAVAWFAGEPNVAHLRVRFFWPVWGNYKVLVLDSEYRWALVAGGSFDYLWILAREPSLPRDVLDSLISHARGLGYDTTRIEFPEQSNPPE